jgi:hypothetical protein
MINLSGKMAGLSAALSVAFLASTSQAYANLQDHAAT